MKSQIVTRRGFLSKAAVAILPAALCGCTSTETRYRPDGTPYTVEQEDDLKTLAAVVLIIILIALWAAAKRANESDPSSNSAEKKPIEKEDDITLANARIHVDNGCECISIADCEGKVVARLNGSGSIEYNNLGIVAKSLFAGEDQIHFPNHPVAIHLEKDDTGQHRIEHVRAIQKLSLNDDSSEVLSHSIEGRFYVSRMRKVSGGIVVEVASPVA